MSLKAITLFFVLLMVAFAERPHLGQRKIYEDPDFLSLVVGGSKAPKASYPYVVSLQQNNSNVFYHFCAGSILNSQWIITAAHCLSETISFIDSFVVKAGKYNIRIVESTEQTAQVEQIFIHEKYLSNNNTHPIYDIGLIKLKTPLKFTKEIQPIELPQAESEPIGTAYLCGWGDILSNWFYNISPNELQHIKLDYIDHDTCNKVIKDLRLKFHIDETNICTGPLTGGISACLGDSGGPLVAHYKQKPVLTGIASWVIVPCGTFGAPSVYTKVSKFNAWIEEKIANHTTRFYRYINL